MACYYHAGREDVATCPQCGKKLCHDCASITVEGICYNCAMSNNLNVKKAFFTDLVILFILIAVAITGTVMMYVSGGDLATVGCLLIIGVGFVPSWRTLTAIADKILGVRAYVGAMLLLAIIFKILFSAILAIFMPFWYLIKFFINLSTYSKIKKNIANIEANYQAVMANN